MNKPSFVNNTAKSEAASSQEVFLDALDLLKNAGVTVCLMRDDPAALEAWDELDILISKNQLQLAIKKLGAAGWQVIDTGSFIPLKCAMIILHKGKLLKFDIHLDLVDGPLVYMNAEWMMNTSTVHSIGANVPCDEAWFLHVVLHVILGKSELHEKYKNRLTHVVSKGIDSNCILAQARTFGLENIIARVIDKPVDILSDLETLFELKQQCRRILLRKFNSNRIRWIKYKFMWSIGQFMCWRRGVLIAVVGPDGAGKTTFLTELNKTLKQLEIPNRNQYMGPWEYPVLPTGKLIRKLGATPLDRIPNTDSSVPATTRYMKLTKGYIKRYIYYTNIVVEMLARYVFKVLPHLMLRRIVIADRYIFDLELGYYNQLVNNSPRLRRFIVSLIPKPDITILLDNDAETIWQRKQEYPLDTIKQSLARYHELAERYGFEIVRTDVPAPKTTEQFIEKFWVKITSIRRDGKIPG